MPGWHASTRALQENGRLAMVGIIQEQHPDRCRLFMQWKQMGWPILVDSLNLLEVPYVPITLLLDEQGIIRQIHSPLSDAERIEEEFLNRSSDPLDPTPVQPRPEIPGPTPEGENVGALRDHANRVVLWGGTERLAEAIDAYTRALALEPADGHTLFRLGVAYRLRHDSAHRQPQDFQNAVTSWGLALERDPNNYIWRRRIQQFGPRTDKPYSFYDWVREARREIEARGEIPVALSVEPCGAERIDGSPVEPPHGKGTEPDPDGRLLRDRDRFIHIETTVVPAVLSPGQTARVHLRLEPDGDQKVHWNNEVEELKLWLDPPENWEVGRQELSFPNPATETSAETRELEFDLRAPDHPGASTIAIPAYALYYICQDEDGVCLYRRQDVDIRVQLRT